MPTIIKLLVQEQEVLGMCCNFQKNGQRAMGRILSTFFWASWNKPCRRRSALATSSLALPFPPSAPPSDLGGIKVFIVLPRIH